MKRIVLFGLLVTGLMVAGCGGDNDGGDAAAADHNDADVTFAREMVPHHEQALEMARLAATQAESPQVQDLARRIEAAQDPEITTMERWLAAWGESERDGGTADHGGDAGLMSEQEMSELRQANGATFDRLFLEMMVRHHESAIEMAVQELDMGKFPEAKQLAREIRDAQRAEVDEMRALLSSPPA
jgi:uncharacterized protein (DUF305 family)